MKISKLFGVSLLMLFLILASGCTEGGDIPRTVEEGDGNGDGDIDGDIDGEEELREFRPGKLQPTQQEVRELEETVLEEMNRTHTPGAAVAIVSVDEIVFSRGFGVSDVETGDPVNPDTLFRIGSVTKMYTAAALLMLSGEGILDLDAPAGNYVEGLSPDLSKLTVHQLLTHTAGLRDEVVSSSDRQDELALSENVRGFNDTLFFTTPGEVFSYSNPGYALAGLVLEETGAGVGAGSGTGTGTETETGAGTGEPAFRPYADQVRERVFLPLGMKRTTFRLSEAAAYSYSQGHYILPNGTPAVVRPFPDNKGYWPAGFMFSNVNELSRFAIAFMNEGELEGKQVLSPSLIRELSTPRTPVFSGYDNGSYGYGLYIYEHRGVKVVGHGGGLEGFTCQFLMVPEQRFAVIALTNTYGSELPESTEKAMDLFLPLDAEMLNEIPEESEETEKDLSLQISEEELAACVGSYFNTPDLSLELIGKDGRLFLKLGELEAPVTKVGKQRFSTYHPLTQQPVEFVLVPGVDGKPAYLHIARRALKKVQRP